jgi:hypothetical protein
VDRYHLGTPRWYRHRRYRVQKTEEKTESKIEQILVLPVFINAHCINISSIYRYVIIIVV